MEESESLIQQVDRNMKLRCWEVLRINMNVTIRKAHQQDFPEVIGLIREFAIFQGTPEKVPTTAEQMAEDIAHFHCFIAEANNNKIVGFATFFLAYYSWTGKALYLDDLYVRKEFRKQGVGKMLLDAAIDLATSEKCKKLRWQVSKWNLNAIDFYKKMGAAIDETEINCDLIIKQGI